MDYVIIDNEDLGMTNPVECGDLQAVQREVLEKLKNARTPRVFVEIPYDVNVKVREDKLRETVKSKTKSDKNTADTSDGPVRRGDKEATPELGPGGGDPGADSDTEN